MILDDDPSLKEKAITQKKYIAMFGKFFEFQDQIKKDLANINKVKVFQHVRAKNQPQEQIQDQKAIGFAPGIKKDELEILVDTNHDLVLPPIGD